MKKFITAGYSIYEFDTETVAVKEVDANVSNMIDYTFVVPEDGELVDNEGNIPVKSGDVILKLYGIYDDEADNRKPSKHIILDSDTEFAKYIIEEHNRSIERKNTIKNEAACCCSPK